MGTSTDTLPGTQALTSVLAVLVALLSMACVVSGLPACGQCVTPESVHATATAETSLTEAHGAEVRGAIERFELNWLSLEAHLTPSVQSELATGPYLDYWGYERMGDAIYDEPFWLVSTWAEVKKLRVLEYSPERFKAVASVARRVDKTTTEGEVVESALPRSRCGIYVFVREDDMWKLASFFLTMGTPEEIERDWEYAPDWLKAIVGELPDGELCEW